MALSYKETLRISETISMIPQNIASILEVGCGDGRVSKGIDGNFTLIGTDIRSSEINKFPGTKFISDISNLPIKDKKFDLILSTEVLEHLDNKTFSQALGEISRVAKRYILITVPFEENLSVQWMKCSICAQIFHAWGHLRKFNSQNLKELFDGADLVEKRFFSPNESRIPPFTYVIIKKLGNVWSTGNSLCPRCGSKPLQSEGNMFGKILQRLIWRFIKVSPFKKPIWVGCLYEKS